MATKTANKNARAGVTAKALPDAGVDALVSLSNGSRAYVFFPKGLTKQLATASPEFSEAIRELVALGRGDKVRQQLANFADVYPASAWPGVCDRLEAEDVFAA
jgi:hypothetical protein